MGLNTAQAQDGASVGEHFTLQEAIRAAFENNHQIQIQEIEKQKAGNLVTRGNAGQLPTVSLIGDLNLSYSDLELTPGTFFENLLDSPENQQEPQQNETGSTVSYDGVTSTGIQAGIKAQYVIFDGFKGRHRYRLLERSSEITQLQYENKLEETTLEITRKFIETAKLQNSLALQELTLEQSRDRYETVMARKEYEHINEQQVLQARADMKTDSVRYRNVQLQYETAYRELHNAIGWEVKDTKPLETELIPIDLPDYEQLFESVYSNNTGVAILKERIRIAESEHELARAEFMPALKASAQYGYQYLHATEGQFETQKDLGVRGGLTLTVPIFTGGRNRTEVENAKASIRQEEIAYRELEQQLRTAFDNSWSRFQHLQNQLETERANRTVYERNYERAQDFHQRGLITGVELRSAQLSLHSARNRISELEFELRLVEATLLYLSGRIIEVR